MPQNIAVAVEARRSGRLMSAAIAIMFGSAAPKPKPASARTATRVTNSVAKVVARCCDAEGDDRADEDGLASNSIRKAAAKAGAHNQREI